jgi:hypothetical protein
MEGAAPEDQVSHVVVSENDSRSLIDLLMWRCLMGDWMPDCGSCSFG